MGSSEILRASTGRLKRSFVSCSERGLHRGRVAKPRVSSYLTFPPLHVKRAVSLCCTFPGVAPAGRYPALCPAELGLSSSYTANCSRQTPGNLCFDTDAIVWLTHILISVFFLKIPAFFTAAYLHGTVQTAGISISFTNKTLKIV